MSLLAQAAQSSQDPRIIFAVAIAGIALLLLLIIYFKWHAFLALLLVSFVVALAAGIPPETIGDNVVKKGMGDTLGFIAIVVGLGAMFGQMLEVSGGAERLAQSLLQRFGEKRAQWALLLTGFIVSIPVFFDVALVILIPIIYSLSRKANRSLLYYGIPLCAGGAVTHAFIPPTPGPALVAAQLNADFGWVILFGILAGIPAAIIAGPVYGTWIARRIFVAEPEYMTAEIQKRGERKDLPSFRTVLFLILFPLVLILIYSVAKNWVDYVQPKRAQLAGAVAATPAATAATLPAASAATLPAATAPATTAPSPGHDWRLRLAHAAIFIGHPFVALLLTTLLAFILLGRLRGYSRDDIQSIANKALEPAGIIILITGAGGVFKEVLQQSGIGRILEQAMKDSSLPELLVAYLITVFIRIAQGSATVAMIMGAGIMAQLEMTPREAALATIAIAAGATIFSHLNDSGFWLVNRFFGMSVKDTLKSWSVVTTIASVVGFAAICILSLIF